MRPAVVELAETLVNILTTPGFSADPSCIYSKRSLQPSLDPVADKKRRLEEPRETIFKNAPDSMRDFTQHLSIYRAQRMLRDIKALILTFSVGSPIALPFDLPALRPSGFLIREWVDNVKEYFPDIFELPQRYLFESPYLDQQVLRDLLHKSARSAAAPPLSFPEALFLRTVESITDIGLSGQSALGHIVTASIIIAAGNASRQSISPSLLPYLDETIFSAFHRRAQSILTTLRVLKDYKKNNELANFAPLAYFMVGGVRGLLLGSVASRALTPSSSAQHVHFLALGNAGRDPDSFWMGTFRYLYGAIESTLAGEVAEIGELELARAIARDFLLHWRTTGQPIPWIYPRNRKGAPPPRIDLHSI